MMVVFVVMVAPGANPETLLTKETLSETKAQVMTEEAAPEVTPKVVTAVSDDVASLLAEWGED